MRSIRVFAKKQTKKKTCGDPYYEPTIVVHDMNKMANFSFV